MASFNTLAGSRLHRLGKQLVFGVILMAHQATVRSSLTISPSATVGDITELQTTLDVNATHGFALTGSEIIMMTVDASNGGANAAGKFTPAALLVTGTNLQAGVSVGQITPGGTIGAITPGGTVSQPTFSGAGVTPSATASSPAFTGNEVTPSATASTPAFTGNAFTPSGSVAAPTFTGDEIAGANVTGDVAIFTGDPQAPGPAFVSNDAGGFIGQPPGTTLTASVDPITPSGTVSAPAFTGNSVTPTGSVSAPTITVGAITPAGTVAAPTITVGEITPSGTVSQPTFTGNSVTPTFTGTPVTPSVTGSNTNVTHNGTGTDASAAGQGNVSVWFEIAGNVLTINAGHWKTNAGTGASIRVNYTIIR
jgi:hypothetical protein